MRNRTSRVMASIRAGRQVADEVIEQRKRKKQETNPVGVLHDEWVVSMRGLLGQGVTIPKWAGEDWGLAKKLVGDLGFDIAVDVTRHFIATWESRRRHRDELPGIKLCWVIRQRLLGELQGELMTPKSKAERLMRGEYEEDNSPKTGWGTWD